MEDCFTCGRGFSRGAGTVPGRRVDARSVLRIPTVYVSTSDGTRTRFPGSDVAHKPVDEFVGDVFAATAGTAAFGHHLLRDTISATLADRVLHC